MIPTISPTPHPAPWNEVERSAANLLVDYEQGGAVLGTYSESNAFVWLAEALDDGVWVSREGVAPVRVVEAANVTEVALAFDAAMNPHVAYVVGGVVYLRYWDSLNSAYATLTVPDARSPRLATDEKNPLFSGDRDVILTYMKGALPYVRVQRERFATEHALTPDPETASKLTPTSSIAVFGRTKGNRVQWRFTP